MCPASAERSKVRRKLPPEHFLTPLLKYTPNLDYVFRSAEFVCILISIARARTNTGPMHRRNFNGHTKPCFPLYWVPRRVPDRKLSVGT